MCPCNEIKLTKTKKNFNFLLKGYTAQKGNRNIRDKFFIVRQWTGLPGRCPWSTLWAFAVPNQWDLREQRGLCRRRAVEADLAH